VRTLLPDDQQLLFDQQLRDASFEQLQDLIARVDLLLRSKGQSGLTLHHPKMSLTPQSLPIPQTQVPSAPSSSLCPDNAEGQRSRWLVRIYFADLRASLACATTLRRGDQLTECSMSRLPCPSVSTSY
jgi:hypothetical protein